MAHRDDKPPLAANHRRRGFLLTLGTGGIAAAAAVVKPLADAVPEPVAAAPEAGVGYRETDHVRHYYRTTKI